MKLYIERRDGMIRVRQIVKARWNDRAWLSTVKKVNDTPANYKDLLRWADLVGHTIEEKPPHRPL